MTAIASATFSVPAEAVWKFLSGNATASDVLKVIDHVRKTVSKKLNVDLELEVKVIGV